MKAKTIGILITILVFHIFFSADAAALQVSAKSAVLICADTGQVLFALNENEKRAMASTTKIMTALIGIEHLPLDTEICVGNEVLNIDGTSLGLKPGDKIRAYDLLVGLMLSSGNDAANAVAVAVAGSVDAFIAMMNLRAQEIGMTNSSFATASGLDGEKHYSTALDMALLTMEAMRNHVFAQIVGQYTTTIRIGEKKIWLQNHNRLLQSYDGMIGVKTGFTKKSGRCLVTAAQREDVSLIAVTLSAADDWNDHRRMLDFGFSVAQTFSVLDKKAEYYVDVVGGTSDKVVCGFSDIPKYCSDTILEIDTSVQLLPFVYAPVETGDVVGRMQFSCNGKILAEVPLCVQQDVKITAVADSQSSSTARNRFLQLLNGWFSYG